MTSGASANPVRIPISVRLDGAPYKVVCYFPEPTAQFGMPRAIVEYIGGSLVMADQMSDSEWQVSSAPARPGIELDTLNSLMEDGTTVTVTKPDGSSETHQDP